MHSSLIQWPTRRFLVSWQSSFHPRTWAWDLQLADPLACSCRYVKRMWGPHGSFHGPGLEVEHVISAICFIGQELSRVVFPNNKGGWEIRVWSWLPRRKRKCVQGTHSNLCHMGLPLWLLHIWVLPLVKSQRQQVAEPGGAGPRSVEP